MMYYIKPLNWVETENLRNGKCGCVFTAQHPIESDAFNPKFQIFLEEGLYWAIWDSSLPGYKSADILKSHAQEAYEQDVKEFIDEYIEF